jgi:cell division protein FtsQ
MSARKPGTRRPAGRKRAAGPPEPVAVPVAPRRLWAFMIWGGGGLALAAASAWALAGGLHQRLGDEMLAASARAGFTARQVQVIGNHQQDRLSVYAAVLDDGTDALLALDLRAIRARIETLPWVERARITRRWPDTIEVELVERVPVAVWQHRGELRVIDLAGEPLPVADVEAYRHLPLLVGTGANKEAKALLAMLRAEPELAESTLAAIRVGARRWDLRLATGETVSLPEGEAAESALRRFAALDRAQPLRGQGFLRLDLRVPDRLVVRLSPEAQDQARSRAREEAEARRRAEAEGTVRADPAMHLQGAEPARGGMA